MPSAITVILHFTRQLTYPYRLKNIRRSKTSVDGPKFPSFSDTYYRPKQIRISVCARYNIILFSMHNFIFDLFLSKNQITQTNKQHTHTHRPCFRPLWCAWKSELGRSTPTEHQQHRRLYALYHIVLYCSYGRMRARQLVPLVCTLSCIHFDWHTINTRALWPLTFKHHIKEWRR